MILLQSYHILIHETFFVQLYDGEVILTKKIGFTFFLTLLNKTTFKDKTQIVTFSSSSLSKPKTIKKWKEKWN